MSYLEIGRFRERVRRTRKLVLLGWWLGWGVVVRGEPLVNGRGEVEKRILPE